MCNGPRRRRCRPPQASAGQATLVRHHGLAPTMATGVVSRIPVLRGFAPRNIRETLNGLPRQLEPRLLACAWTATTERLVVSVSPRVPGVPSFAIHARLGTVSAKAALSARHSSRPRHPVTASKESVPLATRLPPRARRSATATRTARGRPPTLGLVPLVRRCSLVLFAVFNVLCVVPVVGGVLENFRWTSKTSESVSLAWDTANATEGTKFLVEVAATVSGVFVVANSGGAR